ncbi:MAG: hypothetical protein WCY09_05115 [Candidatus Omnitrophota bacterium]
MEKIAIIAVVLASILLLAWSLLRIIKEDDSPCLRCSNLDKNLCACKKNNLAEKGAKKS